MKSANQGMHKGYSKRHTPHIKPIHVSTEDTLDTMGSRSSIDTLFYGILPRSGDTSNRILPAAPCVASAIGDTIFLRTRSLYTENT